MEQRAQRVVSTHQTSPKKLAEEETAMLFQSIAQQNFIYS
ncbi:hypothetical protein DB29_00658 [Shouchella clausii]|nr:hypothetical protein DB29_00658 [Shouchella clausii]